MLLSYFEAVFKIVELNTTEVELSGAVSYTHLTLPTTSRV